MPAGGTRVTNKQSIALAQIADGLLTNAKLAGSVTNSKLSSPYHTIQLWDGQVSSLYTGQNLAIFNIPKDCWAVKVTTATSGAYPSSGAAAMKLHLHVLDLYSSSVASANLYCAPTVSNTALMPVETTAVLTTKAQSGATGRLMCHYSGSHVDSLNKCWVTVSAKTYNIA